MEYWTEYGQNLIGAWNAAQDEETQVVFDTTVQGLEGTEDWEGLKQVKELKRGHVGLWEIRFKIARTKTRPVVQCRPIGFVRCKPQGAQPGEFVLLLGCKKYGRNTIPPNAFHLALCLKRAFEQDGKGALYDLSL